MGKVCVFCGEILVRRRRVNGRLEGAEDWRNRIFCNQECYHAHHTGENHHNYKGGIRRGHEGGYLRTSDGRYIHRVVMEEHLGRKLSTDEHVHHIDGNVENNDISNLQLVSNSEHRQIHAKTCLRDKEGRFAK